MGDKATKDTQEGNKPPAHGQYEIHLVRQPKDKPDQRFEVGTIVITDPSGKIVADCPYKSGNSHRDCAPEAPSYKLARDIVPFKTGEKKHPTLDGLRIDNSSFKGTKRSGFLIHWDNPPQGTLGCFGIQGKENWDKFEKAWNSIPRDQRPTQMRPMSKDDYEALKASQKTLKATDTKTGFLPNGDTIRDIRETFESAWKESATVIAKAPTPSDRETGIS